MPRALIRLGLIVVLALSAGDALAGDCAQRIARYLGRAVKGDADTLARFAKNVVAGSAAEDGFVYALDFVAKETGEAAATQQVANILRAFPQSPRPFEWISKVKGKPGLKKEIEALGSNVANNFKGAASELRYGSEVLGPDNLTQFQLEIPGGVPDLLDGAGNLHEIKYREWSVPVPDIIRSDLERILGQANNAQQYALSQGKLYTLAFEVPVPLQFQEMFNSIFAEFKTRPNVTIRMGF